MQRIRISGTEPFRTTDGVADALLDYAVALAAYHQHDVVRLPVIDAGRNRTWLRVLLGPGMQLSSLEVPTNVAIDDDGVAEDLRARTARVRCDPADAAPAAFFDWIDPGT